jgi:glycosyltransferase involved in cell wall biosynthesis
LTIDAANRSQVKPSILVVTQLYPNVVTSFLGTFVAQQLQHLKTRYTIVVLTTHYVPLTRRHRLRQPRYQFRDGIHVYSLPHVAYWLFGFRLVSQHLQDLVLIDKLLTGRKIERFARSLHRRYRFSLVHGHETYVGDEAAAIGRMLRIPSVFTLDGVYWYHLKAFGKAVLQRAVANINACDRLTALSRVSAGSYREHGVYRDFHIIPNGVELQRPDSPQPKLPEAIATFTRGKFVLLTVGFFAAEKRIEQSIRTLARLHQNGITNTVLVIIGKGRLEAWYRRLIEQEKLADAARIVGEVLPQNMSGYYSVADVLVHPSTVESFSMVCLEAMSHGKPVICTSNIGLVEYLCPGRDAVVIPPDDAEALYQAVLGLIQNPSRRRMLGEQGRRTAARLSWADQVRKIERVYEEVLSK